MGYLKVFIGAILIFAAAPLAAQAADFDGSKPLLCAVISITECTSNDGCQKTTLENAGMPQFLKFDPMQKDCDSGRANRGKKADRN